LQRLNACLMTLTNNYLLGQWEAPKGDLFAQHDAVTGALIAHCGSGELDYASILAYAREIGGPALRKMTFHERGRMLKALALYLTDRKQVYNDLSYRTGATRIDNLIDIDGGISTLFAYASLRRRLPDEPFYTEGEAAKISKEGTFIGHHVLVPRHGVAVHINAFNFPIWGMLEKLSANWMAGMPAVVKPSEITSYLTERMVADIIESGLLPAGALQLVSGPGRGIIDHVGAQDMVTFTGSAHTGKLLRAHPALIEHSVPFNMEADSLNAAILGPDAVVGSPEFDIFIKEVRREIVTKTGQKCTAIRRIIVPAPLVDAVQAALATELAKTKAGDPRHEQVRMGALASRTQLVRVREAIGQLSKESELVYGNPDLVDVLGADPETGAFIAPILLRNDRPLDAESCHNIEAFGPVCTIMTYRELEEAAVIANMGKGSLVSTLCTNDQAMMKHYMMEAAPWHGRIHFLNRHSAKESTGHGSPMPQLTHGGPGRAGGGQELGGLRSVFHCMQRTAIQGHPSDITAVTNQYQIGGARPESAKHPFRYYFDDLVVGQTLTTHKHTVSEADISNFANVSGDNFYAHMDATSLAGTPFDRRVAHGYFVLSKAAGLFVDPGKGPVLLNYGLDECRFTKPVYPGMTIGVQLTVREKILQEFDPTREGVQAIPRGIVKWLVDVTDETGETVAIATILTMLKSKVSKV
jgi:oxepin-CoA hydrolase / 3-oxo-5,6-dehydrosuberyl-CoA semialdehyde dehydrogenase